MKIANAIPVCYKHFDLLNEAIDSILNQTLLPYEVIVVISAYPKTTEDENKIKSLEETIQKKGIKCTIKTYPKKQFAGQNRQIAFDCSVSDIVIYQDCDDLPHRQRNEIIRFVHEKTNSNHILHGWSKSFDETFIVKEDLELINISVWPRHVKDIGRIANGPVSIVKNNIKQLVFPNKPKGQDETLNKNIVSEHKGTVLIKNDAVYNYRNALSSWKRRK